MLHKSKDLIIVGSTMKINGVPQCATIFYRGSGKKKKVYYDNKEKKWIATKAESEVLEDYFTRSKINDIVRELNEEISWQ